MLTNTDTFVDKTELIKILFEPPKYHYITHPHGFGKSVNLQMIRDFLQFRVDSNTVNEIEDKTVNENYNLFKDSRLNLKVAQDEAFFERHFGEYPILHLDFSHIDGNTYVEMLTQIRIEVQKLCQRYHYFYGILEKRMNATTKFERLLGERYFSKFAKLLNGDAPECDVLDSVRMLSELINRHFTKRAILLVDGVDTLIMRSLRRDMDYGDAYFVIQSLLTPVFGGIDRVSHALLSGTSRMICATSSFEIMELEYYSFFEGNKYAPYFGLTEEEVSLLCDKHRISAEERVKLKEFFGGYYVLGKSMYMYNSRDVVNYLKSRSFMDYYVDTEATFELAESVRVLKVRKEVISLLAHKQIEYELELNATYTELHFFVDFTHRKPGRYDPIRFAATLYLEIGYLAPAGEKANTSSYPTLKIPNLKARFELKEALSNFYIPFRLDLKEHAVAEALCEIAESEKTTNESLLRLQTDVHSIFDRFDEIKMAPRLFINRMEIFSMMYSIVVYNVERATINVLVKGVEGQNHTEKISMASILIPSRNDKILLMVKITFKNTTEQALSQINSCIPAKGEFNATVIKYVAINIGANYKIDVQDGANLYRNNSWK